MKILVLNGSPKGDKSDTMHMTRAFLAGMDQVSENEVRIIHASRKHIEYCTGCLSCMRNGGTCVHHDDMPEILEEILDSDVLLLSFPLYCYGMPAPLKALIDRTLPLSSIAMRKVGDHYEHIGQRDFSKLRYVMISGCGFPNGRNNFEPAVIQFRRMFRGDSTVITVPEAPMFNVPEAKRVTEPFLAKVRQAGREYAESGAVSEGTMAALAEPMIPEETYAQIVNAGAP
ncbi:MAG: flavodoxin family protein [Firmicutes bacterium]|nr:flavodoxin family protein [Bacillota bacterium]